MRMKAPTRRRNRPGRKRKPRPNRTENSRTPRKRKRRRLAMKRPTNQKRKLRQRRKQRHPKPQRRKQLAASLLRQVTIRSPMAKRALRNRLKSPRWRSGAAVADGVAVEED